MRLWRVVVKARRDRPSTTLPETGDIPWVVGLSGGKDSTAVTMVLLEAIESLPPPLRARKQASL